MRHSLLRVEATRLALAVTPFLFVTGLAGQAPAPDGAPDYKARFEELKRLDGDGRAARVTGLVLTRDRAEFRLESGVIRLLQPVGGRVVGAVFQGEGRLALSPPTVMEQERLRLVRKNPTLQETFDRAVFLFADSTAAELERALSFAADPNPTSVRDAVHDGLDIVGDLGHDWIDADIMRPMLNSEQTGLFYACLTRGGSQPLMFMIDPAEVEGVRVLVTRNRGGLVGDRFPEVATQFPISHRDPGRGEYAERRPEARIQKYVMQIRLPQTGSGDLNFLADADLTIVADTSIGPWVAFELYEKLDLDSARWEDGTKATVYRGDDSPYLWVRLDRRLEKGESRTLRVSYHGDLIDRFGDWFYIKSSISWYPVALASRSPAMFDLTFATPVGFSLAAVGNRTDSAAAGNMIRTRWETTAPIRNASFNVGLFEQYAVPTSGPPVWVLWSDDMHKRFVQAVARAQEGSDRGEIVLSGKNMKQQVGDDIVNALKFYEHVYGKAPVNQFYATEIPWLHGEAWPGIIGLSWVTFQKTDDQGEDEVFRAHEVAHQWWGISVDYATYHDRWLSEGLADFSGLWYLQTRRQKNDKYFGVLDRWKSSIMLRRDEPIPIALGHRVATARTGDDYSTIVYQKGAWVMHMLRILLLDMKTMSEDRFTETMQDFYTTYAGHRASTADLQAMVEKHTGLKMDWFFNQWVYGTGIPTYKVSWKAEPGTGDTWLIRLRVDQEKVPPEFLMYVPVTVETEKGQVVRLRVKVTGATTEVTLPPMPAKPKTFKFNDLQGVLAEVKG